MFFTLSGYLITGIVLRDHELSVNSLGEFWRRRARRLLPASLVTIAATVGVVASIDSAALGETATAGLASALYVHNWWSAAAIGGYWEIFEQNPSPLAHMWSLAIEEQVYLVWPLALLLLGPRRAIVFGAVVVAGGYVIWWGSSDAYYATPFRFAEVLTGAVLAVVVARRGPVRIPGWLAGSAGVVLLALTVTLEESDPAVATGALLLVAGLGAVITARALSGPEMAMVLGRAPLVWLGRRSYAIYLFHWPLLVWFDGPLWLKGTAAGATFLLAEVSHRVIEWPIRSGARLARPLAVLLGTTAVLATSLVVVEAVAPKAPSVAEVAAITEAALATTTTTTTTTVAPTTVASESRPDPSTTTTTAPALMIDLPANAEIVLIGDSTAFAAIGAFEGWVRANGGTAIPRAWAVCSPVFFAEEYANWETAFGGLSGPCRPEVSLSTDLVVVMDHGAVFIDHISVLDDEWYDVSDAILAAVVRRSYAQLIEQTAEADAQVLILTAPVPLLPELEIVGELEKRMAAYDEILAEVSQFPHVHLLDVGPIIDADGVRYSRMDGLHLDPDTGAVNLFTDLVAPVVRFAPRPIDG